MSPDSNCANRVYQNSGNLPFLRSLQLDPPGNALDCGCGAGDNARALRAAGWRVTGITISPEEAVRALHECDSVHLADLEQGIPTDARGPFDLILFSHVLEHLRDPCPALRDAQKLLSPSGVIAVALPNVLYWRQRLEFLLGRFQYDDAGIMDRTHLRFFTFVTGKQMLESYGLHVVHATVDGGFPSRYLRRVLPAWSARLDRLAERLMPNLFGYESFYLTRPEPAPEPSPKTQASAAPSSPPQTRSQS